MVNIAFRLGAFVSYTSMEVQAIVSPEQTETSTTVEKEDVSSDKTKDEFGGDIEKPAYCLITGKYEVGSNIT